MIIFGANQSLAEDKVRDIINEIENNQWLTQTFPHLKPAKDLKKQWVSYTDKKIVFGNGAVLMAKAIGTASRGLKSEKRRPDLVILDDMQKDSDVESPTKREKDKKWFDTVIKYLGGIGQSYDIVAIDTLKHYDALIYNIYNKQGWERYKWSAVISEREGKVLWDSVYVYHVDDLTDNEKENWAKRVEMGTKTPLYGKWYAKAEDSEPTIVGLGEGGNEEVTSFNQEFLSIVASDDEMPLRKSLWQFFDYSESTIDQVPIRIGALDLAMGRSKTGDYQAIAVVGNLGSDYFLLDASLTRFDLVKDQDIEKSLAGLCVLFIKNYRLKYFVVEDNGTQGLFLNTLRKLDKQEDVSCKIVGRQSKTNKEERIKGNLGLIMQRGSFYIRRDFQNCYGDFMRQFDHFPKGAHDDAPDVSNMAIMAIQSGKSSGYGRG